jgi:Tfp pilus assembly protein PilF
MTARRKYVLSAIVVIFLFPLVFLFYRASQAPPLPPRTRLLNSPDITELEKSAFAAPTIDNLLALSTEYINKQMPGKSIEPLKKALEISPDNAAVHNNLAVAYTMLKQYGDAIAEANLALKLDPSFQLAKNNLAWATAEKKKVLEKIAALENIPEQQRNADQEIDLGLNYFYCGDYGKSITIWSAVAEKDPANHLALNNIGTAFMMKSQYDDAISMFTKALEIKPDDQLAKNNLSWAHAEKEKSLIKK